MTGYKDELKRIQAQVEVYENDQRKSSSVVDLMEEGSHYSDHMIEIMKDNEDQLCKLDKKRKELEMLNKVADQNYSEIQKVHQAVKVMKHQRAEMQGTMHSDSTISTYTNDNHEYPLYANHHRHLLNSIPRTKTHTDSFLPTIVSSPDGSIADSPNATEDKEQIRVLKDEIISLKEALVNKFDSPYERNPRIMRSESVDEDRRDIPLTLNLKTGTGTHNDAHSLQRTDSGIDAVNQYYEIGSYYRNTDPDQYGIDNEKTPIIGQRKQRLMSDSSNTSNQYYPYKYDISLTRLSNNCKGGSSSSGDDTKDCSDHCNTGFFTNLFYEIFGKPKDPIVRQW